MQKQQLKTRALWLLLPDPATYPPEMHQWAVFLRGFD
jgi:hypothetical protein